MFRKYLINLLVAVAVLLLAACGGGGGGGGSGDSSLAPDGNPDGIYSGNFVQNGVTFNMAGIVFDNRFVGASIDAGALYTGDIEISGNSFEGAVDVLIIGGGFDHTTSFSGTFVEGSSFTGVSTDIDTATFTFDMDPVFNRPPNVNLAGTYGYTDGAYTFTVNVADDGSFLGSDTDGCLFSGTQVAVDSTHNLYRLVLNVAACGANDGSYVGYAFNDDGSMPNDLLDWVFDDPDFVAVVVSQRQ